ncbi:MAG: hypothetical protein ACJ75P_12000 [Gaiellaceae bacterium]
MAPDPQYLSILVALDAVLLLILAGVAKKQLEWKRSEYQPISRRGRERSQRPAVVPIPGWMKGVLVAGICLGGAVASGAGLVGALAPPAVVAYVAAAILVVFATR